MAYTTINKSSEYFNTVTWSGNSSNPRNITGVGFQPDWVWGKIKSTGGNHYAIDVVRGSGTGTLNTLNTDDTSAEQTNTSGGSTSFGVYTSFDSDGFTVNAGSLSAKNTNESGQTYIAWNWLGGGTGVSNTDGSITSTVSANNTDGFSIVKYTGTGSAGTVGHGLSTAPKVLINKALGTQDWFVGHSSIGFTKFLKLNEANAESTNSGIWNNTAPTSSVFTINSANGNTNSTGVEYITYCFAEKKGFSKFGSYTGNGNADGTFIYTGFKPAYVLTKRTDVSDNWVIQDNKQSPFNPTYDFLLADSSGIPTAGGTPIDLLSNGFKVRTTSAYSNASGGTYIYMAFAEQPLVGTNNIPATAR
jgi:hypothetical protein